jgi:hypothetical protein
MKFFDEGISLWHNWENDIVVRNAAQKYYAQRREKASSPVATRK